MILRSIRKAGKAGRMPADSLPHELPFVLSSGSLLGLGRRGAWFFLLAGRAPHRFEIGGAGIRAECYHWNRIGRKTGHKDQWVKSS